MTMSTRDWQTLLSDRSYDIEFNGYLSNHVKHAVIALQRLQAPPERVEEYWDNYTKLTPYDLCVHHVTIPWDQVKPVTEAEFMNLRGKKEKWQEQCVFLQNELENQLDGDVDRLIQKYMYVPSIFPGMAGALTHGIIHLGWAIDSENTWMIIEGLAYLNFAYVGMPENSLVSGAHSDATALDSLTRVAKEFQEKRLQQTWIEATKSRYNKDSGFHVELIPAGFQWELSKVLAHPHEVATHLPLWLDTLDLASLWEELYRVATTLYWATRDDDGNGDFLVLHLVTSLWGAEAVSKVINSEDATRVALKHYYAVLVSLLSTSSGGFPSQESLETAAEELGSHKNDNLEDETKLWSAVVAKALPEIEEHNIKLVYVMRELWRRYRGWAAFRMAADTFTLTPNISPARTDFKA